MTRASSLHPAATTDPAVYVDRRRVLSLSRTCLRPTVRPYARGSAGECGPLSSYAGWWLDTLRAPARCPPRYAAAPDAAAPASAVTTPVRCRPRERATHEAA